MIQPGEVYLADFEEAGPHPVIVVSREELNRGRVCACRRLHVSQRQRILTLCVSEGFDEEIGVPTTTATFHDQTVFAGMLLEE